MRLDRARRMVRAGSAGERDIGVHWEDQFVASPVAPNDGIHLLRNGVDEGRLRRNVQTGKSRNRRCSPLYREFYEQVRRFKCDIERSFRDSDAIEAGATEETAQFLCLRQRKGDIEPGHWHAQMARRRFKQRLVCRMATERLP
jgi:hypothetical protein